MIEGGEKLCQFCFSFFFKKIPIFFSIGFFSKRRLQVWQSCAKVLYKVGTFDSEIVLLTKPPSSLPLKINYFFSLRRQNFFAYFPQTSFKTQTFFLSNKFLFSKRYSTKIESNNENLLKKFFYTNPTNFDGMFDNFFKLRTILTTFSSRKYFWTRKLHFWQRLAKYIILVYKLYPHIYWDNLEKYKFRVRSIEYSLAMDTAILANVSVFVLSKSHTFLTSSQKSYARCLEKMDKQNRLVEFFPAKCLSAQVECSFDKSVTKFSIKDRWFFYQISINFIEVPSRFLCTRRLQFWEPNWLLTAEKPKTLYITSVFVLFSP